MTLNNLFQPKSVAIIGASSNPEKIGRQILDNIIDSKYQGSIFPINLKSKKIAKLTAYRNLSDAPVKIWEELLVVIAIPAQYVIIEIKKCAALGIKNIIVISAGFKEAGRDGKKREDEMIEIAKEYGINILGPNCLGLINNIYGLNASFAESSLVGGKIALLSQSGAIGSAVLDWLKDQKLNLGYFISLGNKAVLNENHFLDYLKKDKNIDAIVYYLEDIKEGKEFMAKASLISPYKPVIVLLAGLSHSGSDLAKSHTGALAKEEEIITAGLERAGVIMVKKLSDLFSLISILRAKSSYKKIGAGVKIITNAGGLAVLTADSIDRNNLKLISSEDILGDATALDYKLALQKVLKEKNNDSILILLTPQSATKPLEIAKVVVSLSKKYPKKVILCSFIGGGAVNAANDLLAVNNLSLFLYPEGAIKALSLLQTRQDSLNGFRPYKISKNTKKVNIKTDYIGLLKDLSVYGIKSVLTKKYQKGKSIIKFPLVLKAVGPDFIHKSDSGSVILNLNNQAQVDKAASGIYKKNLKAFRKSENYLILQPQIKEGLEIIIGLKRDDSFGHVLLIGMGGIYAETIKQSRVLIADITKKEVLGVLKKMPFFPILNGVRGKKYNIDGLLKAVVSLCDLAKIHPEIKELDINPMIINEKETLALDARVFID